MESSISEFSRSLARIYTCVCSWVHGDIHIESACTRTFDWEGPSRVESTPLALVGSRDIACSLVGYISTIDISTRTTLRELDAELLYVIQSSYFRPPASSGRNTDGGPRLCWPITAS